MNLLANFTSNIASAAQNRHVSIPVLLAFGCEAGKIWLPNYRNQFDATQKLLFGYAAIAAGNSAPGLPGGGQQAAGQKAQADAEALQSDKKA